MISIFSISNNRHCVAALAE